MPYLLLTILLLVVVYQDFKYRAVWWVVFPLAAGIAIWSAFSTRYFDVWLMESVINSLFLIVQFMVLTVYFSVKLKKPVWIFDQFIGWGDVLFLFVLALLLSPVNFIVFYLGSIVLTLLFAAAYLNKRNENIPLAGIQAALFLVILAGDQILQIINLTSDQWFLAVVGR